MSRRPWEVAPAVETFQQQLDEARPGRRDGNPDGTIGDEDHAARDSDHNPDDDDDVCAVDVHDGPQLDDGELYESLKQAGSRNPQLKYAINNGRIYSPAKGEHAYHGLNAHKDHCHVSVTQALKNSRRPWVLPGITDREADDMTPDEFRNMLQDELAKIHGTETKGKDADPTHVSLLDVLRAQQATQREVDALAKALGELAARL